MSKESSLVQFVPRCKNDWGQEKVEKELVFEGDISQHGGASCQPQDKADERTYVGQCNLSQSTVTFGSPARIEMTVSWIAWIRRA